jgi:UDP-glucose 4-epimerase
VERLLEHGADVSVLCRSRHLYDDPAWAGQVTWYELDGLSDNESMISAVSSAGLIYDLAGASGAVASNLDAAHNLNANCAVQLAFLRACEIAGHRPHVVFASSWLVYDLQGTKPVAEDRLPGPRSMYAAHKLCVENYLRISALRGKITYTVCRISNPYGSDRGKPTKAYKILNTFVQNAMSGSPICLFGDGSQLRDFIYISDLTDAFLLCGLPEAQNEIFNISLGVSHSMREAVEAVTELVGRTQILYRPWPAEYEAAEPGSYVADITKASSRLGFAPKIELRRGLEETIRQLRIYAPERPPLRASAHA